MRWQPAAILLAFALPVWALTVTPTTAHLPRAGHTTVRDPEVRARVDLIVKQTLDHFRPERMELFGTTGLRLGRELFANPPLKYLQVHASCGHSHLGSLPPQLALAPTRQLFAAYGLMLRPRVKVECGGTSFVADGYDPHLRVGFKLLWESGAEERLQKLPAEPPSSQLDADKLEVLDREIEAGRIQLFVADASCYQITDIAGIRAPLALYLDSVVTCLDWLHGEQALDYLEVRGLPRPQRD